MTDQENTRVGSWRLLRPLRGLAMTGEGKGLAMTRERVGPRNDVGGKERMIAMTWGEGGCVK